MKKRIISLLLCGLVLTGCGTVETNTQVSDQKEASSVQEKLSVEKENTQGHIKVLDDPDELIKDFKVVSVYYRPAFNGFVFKNNTDKKIQVYMLNDGSFVLNGNRLSCFDLSYTNIEPKKEYMIVPQMKESEKKYITDGENTISIMFEYNVVGDEKKTNYSFSVALEKEFVEKWLP